MGSARKVFKDHSVNMLKGQPPIGNSPENSAIWPIGYPCRSHLPRFVHHEIATSEARPMGALAGFGERVEDRAASKT
jgi:hypothetical protein